MKLKKILSPIISTFTRNGLKSKNPKNRIRAILEELEPGNPELLNIAINDNDSEVKICAINRLISLNDIQKVILKLNDEKIKTISYQHFSKLLSGEIFPVPELAEREKIINGALPSKTVEYIALKAKESQLRISAIHKVNRDALLGDIALNDSNSQVKINAANQIGKKSINAIYYYKKRAVLLICKKNGVNIKTLLMKKPSNNIKILSLKYWMVWKNLSNNSSMNNKFVII